MYRDEILDLYRTPRNQGKIEGAESSEGENPSCGDTVEVYVKSEEGIVKDVKHRTDGCAISTAAVSVLTEEIKGMEKERLEKLGGDWMIEKLGVEVSPMRRKCAVLGLKTVQQAIEKDSR